MLLDNLRQTETYKAFADLGLAVGMAATLGAMISWAGLIRLSDGQVLAEGLRIYHVWIMGCGAIGAAVGLVLARDEFGSAGLWGLARAVAGTLWTSLFASVIAGTMALPLYGTMFGPFTMALTFTATPMMAGVWLTSLMLVHLKLLVQGPRHPKQQQIIDARYVALSRLH